MSAKGVEELFFTFDGAGDVFFSRPEFMAQCPSLRRVSHAVQQQFDAGLQGLWVALCNWTAAHPSPEGSFLALEREIRVIDATANLNAMEKFARVSRLFEERGVDRRALLGNGYLPCQPQDAIRLQEALHQFYEDDAIGRMWPALTRYVGLAPEALREAMLVCRTAGEKRGCLEGQVSQYITTVYCDGQALPCLPAVIGNCVQLQELSLTRNALVTLPNEVSQLVNLETLYLNQNRFESLPAVVGQLSNLRQLILGWSQLERLPAAIGQLGNLQQLNLCGNQLARVPEELSQLSQLTCANFSENRLTELPTAFGNLTQLQDLDLSDNRFAAFPAVGGCVQLEELVLTNNRLAEILPTLGNLTRLTVLRLGGNQIATLPAEVGSLAQLESLYLNDNQLTAVPAELGRLDRLMTVEMHGNPILFTFNEEWQKIISDDSEGGPGADDESGTWTLPAGRAFFNGAIESFRNYPCQSPFAAFYQQLCLTGRVDPELFYASVPERERNLIYGMVYSLAQEEQGASFSDGGDCQWGQHHAFEDRRRFCFAVRSIVEQLYKELPLEECPSLDNPLVAIDAIMASRGS